MENQNKVIHVPYALRRRRLNCGVYIKQKEVLQENSAKYLVVHLDSRLIWKYHIQQKDKQIRMTLREIYWILGKKHSKLTLVNKRLILRITTIKSIWTYAA